VPRRTSIKRATHIILVSRCRQFPRWCCRRGGTNDTLGPDPSRQADAVSTIRYAQQGDKRADRRMWKRSTPRTSRTERPVSFRRRRMAPDCAVRNGSLARFGHTSIRRDRPRGHLSMEQIAPARLPSIASRRTELRGSARVVGFLGIMRDDFRGQPCRRS